MLLLTLGFVLAACGGNDDDAATSTAAANGSDGTIADGATSVATDLGSLNMGVAGLSAENAPPWIAKAAGFFDEAGLDVELSVDGANLGTNVASGRTDLAGSGIGSGLAITNQGRDVSIVYWWAGRGAASFLLARPEITSPEQCGLVATYPEGTSAYGWAQRYKEGLGLDWDIVVSPDVPTQTAGLRSGQYDCAVSSLTPYLSSIDEGAVHILIDSRDQSNLPENLREFEVVEAALFGLTENLEAKHDEVVAFLSAIEKARQLIETSEPVDIAKLLLGSDETRADWSTFSEEDLAQSFEESKTFLMPNKGVIEPRLWEADQLDFYVTAGLPFIDPSDAKWSYDQRVEMGYLNDALG